MNNAGRHSGASEVDIELVVSDDGAPSCTSGTTAAASTPPSTKGEGGLGLTGMAERARLVGGELDVRSAPGAGTSITLRLPA